MTDAQIELGVMLAELRKSKRDSDKALASEIVRITDAMVAAARSQALQEAAQAVAHKALEVGYQKALEDFRTLVKKKTQWSAWNVLCTVENKHVPEDWGWRDELSSLVAQPAAGMTLAEVKDKYFPNVTLDQLEGRDKKTPLIVLPKPAAAPLDCSDLPRWPKCRNCKHSNPHKDVGGRCEDATCTCKDFDPSDNRPVAAPACPNYDVTGQVSGPGTVTLCMACGAVEL